MGGWKIGEKNLNAYILECRNQNIILFFLISIIIIIVIVNTWLCRGEKK